MECRGEEGVVFMGVAFRELPVGRSRWRLPQSRGRELQGGAHCGLFGHGTHLLSINHDHWNASAPATRGAIGVMPVAVSLPNAPPTATPSSVMGRNDRVSPSVMPGACDTITPIAYRGDSCYGTSVATGAIR